MAANNIDDNQMARLEKVGTEDIKDGGEQRPDGDSSGDAERVMVRIGGGYVAIDRTELWRLVDSEER
jgi:hypothetical protein